MIDPASLPWTWEYATGSEAWAIVRNAAGDMIARVSAPYGPLFAALPVLLSQGVEVPDIPPTPTSPDTTRGKRK
jgi:hypothetical protein